MSYILLAWEQPIPRSMEEVEPLVSALRADKAMASSANVDAFMARLWAKYPRDLDTEDEEYVWDDSFPSAPQPRPKLIYLCVSFNTIDELMPFLLETARETGMVVYDSEAETVFLPSGAFLGKRPLPPPPPVPKAFDARAGERELIERLKAIFEPLGFKWVKIQAWDHRFVRKFDGGWQSVAPRTKAEPLLDLVEADFYLSTYLDIADRLLGVETGSTTAADIGFVACTFLTHVIEKLQSNLFQDFERRPGSKFTLRSQYDIQRFAEVSGRLVVEEVLPRLDNYRSMALYGQHVLDRTARGEPVLFSEPATVRLAAVGTAAPERFDEMAARELAAWDERIAQLETMTPPRPRPLASEREIRARIAAFIDKHRATLA
jgi:hypothetical protein